MIKEKEVARTENPLLALKMVKIPKVDHVVRKVALHLMAVLAVKRVALRRIPIRKLRRKNNFLL